MVNLLGPKALEHALESLGVSSENNYICTRIASEMDVCLDVDKLSEVRHFDSYDYDVEVSENIKSVQLQNGVHFIRLAYEKDEIYGVVDFGNLDHRK